ncbi:MAG: alpha-amylase family glycosyl hydrolase [Dysgonomonas sp.]|uniref:alpha-amylase family glycosyl hydrolase n=1 Tax=Dysgonomonas sp. TaxID=1891233 RepID=UPI003A89B94A
MKKFHFLVLFLLIFVACSDNNDDPIIPEVPEPPTSGSSIGNLRDGITILSDDSLAFVLFAPGKQSVYLIGDFNDWKVSEAYKMNQEDDRFWIKIGGLEKGKEYICQYLIDNKIRVADPYASKISDPKNDLYINMEYEIYPGLITPTTKTTGLSMVVNTSPAKYSWNISDFRLQNPDNMVVYEVLIRDFTETRSIKGVQEKLDYIKNLGVNAIELMPFNEFEGNDSWGYNPSFYFATDKAYGASNDYKAFIDECHANGIAVIMDMVLNHSYSQSPMVTMYKNDNNDNIGDNPWYNKESPNPDYFWGYDFNHESKYTQAFVDSVCSYWMKEYKVDGFRFDFTKGFTNTKGDGNAFDQPRIDILKRMVNEIRKRNLDAIIIFEHLADNREEKILSDDGIYLWGNINYNFNEVTMGWGHEMGDYEKLKGDISWASYKERGWTKPNLVAYMESHDEERIMFKNNSYGNTNNPSYNVQELPVGLARTEAAAVILMSLPGPKMIWQFGELGYDYSINAREDGYWTSDYQDGRYRTAKKPIKWDYYDVATRKALHDVYARMNKLHTTNPIFSTTDYTIGIGDNFKQILLKSAEGYVCAIANFAIVHATATVNFGKTGTWQDYFTGKTLVVNESTQEITLNPGEYYLYFSK